MEVGHKREGKLFRKYVRFTQLITHFHCCSIGFDLTYDRSIGMLSLLELVITDGFDHEMEATRVKFEICFDVD